MLVLPPRFIPLLSDDWQYGGRPALPLLPLFFYISTRNFPFFFIILFIFLANHSDPAAVCLPMQMLRAEASCSPFLPSRFRQPSLRVHFTIPTGPLPPTLSSSLSRASVWILLVINGNARIPLYVGRPPPWRITSLSRGIIPWINRALRKLKLFRICNVTHERIEPADTDLNLCCTNETCRSDSREKNRRMFRNEKNLA